MIGHVALSPDGRMVVTGSEVVHLYEVATGQERGRFPATNDSRTAVFTPDGRRLVTGSTDTTVLVWDVTARQPQTRLWPDQAAEMERLWSELAGADAVQAYQAIWTCIDNPETTIAFLRERLQRTSPPIASLLSNLDHDRFVVREKAMADLERLATAAGTAGAAEATPFA